MGCFQSSPKPRPQPPDIYRVNTPHAQSKQEVGIDAPGTIETVDYTSTGPLRRPLPQPPDRVVAKVVVALFTYDARTSDDVSFMKGDILEIFDYGHEDDWWLGRVKNSTFEGYIPSNYVSDDQDDIESQDWWYPVVRSQAERMLLFDGLPQGTFLIRHSTSDITTKALSVRSTNQSSRKPEVRHYKIKSTDAGGWWISSQETFDTLLELIGFYQTNPDLCCRLTQPCPKIKPVIPFREMEVDRDTIQIFRELGSGYFGKVYLGKMNGVQDVAVKTLKANKTDKEAFIREAKVMHELRHSKLVQLMGVCTIGDPLYIITELMSEGDLLSYIKKDRGKTLGIANTIDIAYQVAYGMSYLETHNYIHRDLRAANILVGPNNEVKVADFGLARLVSEETNNVYKMSKEAKFPIKWTSPEAGLLGDFSIKSDVWSFGILLYEIVTFGRIPYPGMHGQEVLQKTELGYRMERPVGARFDCPQQLYELMLKCWDKSRDDRPTFEYLAQYLEDFEISSERAYTETDVS